MPLKTITEFYARINACIHHLESTRELPAAAFGLLSKDELEFIYTHVVRERNQISEALTKGSLRIHKHLSKLALTLNFVVGRNHEVSLMAEIKRRRLTWHGSAYKAKFIQASEGTTKKGLPTLRIDVTQPTIYKNMVAKRGKVVAVKDDAAVSQQLAAISEQKGFKDKYQLFVETSVGATYSNRTHIITIGSYSVQANCTLYDVLRNKSKYSPEQLYAFTLRILQGMIIMHKAGIIHQDIHPRNLFIFIEDDEPILRIADFGNSHSAQATSYQALGHLGYESPQVSAVHRMLGLSQKEYYSNSKVFSYGRNIADSQTYSRDQLSEFMLPKDKNDCWAAGMVICQMLFGLIENDSLDANIRSNSLLRGLLEPCENKRLTALQAFQWAQSLAYRQEIGLEPTDPVDSLSSSLDTLLSLSSSSELLFETTVPALIFRTSDPSHVAPNVDQTFASTNQQRLIS